MHRHVHELTEEQLGSVSGGGVISNGGVIPLGGDIAEMCFVVLMNATNDQDKDLHLIMSGATSRKSFSHKFR
jgi:hypothetical protein